MSKPYKPSLLKRLQDKRWFRAITSFLAWLLINVLYLSSRLTCRISQRIHPDAAPYVSTQEQCLYCFWHGRMLFIPFFYHTRQRRVNVLSSGHRDGVIMADTMRWFGFDTIFGSTSKNSMAALRGIMKKIKKGENIAFTPDGPRGPFQKVSPGIIWVAKTSGLPIIPVSFSSTRRKHLRSWDKFLIPKPFGRVIMDAAPPFTIPRDADDAAMEQHRQQLEAILLQQVATLDTECA